MLYLVYGWEWEEFEINGIFTDKDKAIEYAKELSEKTNCICYGVKPLQENEKNQELNENIVVY